MSSRTVAAMDKIGFILLLLSIFMSWNCNVLSAKDPEIDECFSYDLIQNLRLKCSGLFGRDSHNDSFISVTFKTQTCSVITWENKNFQCIVNNIKHNLLGPVIANVSSRTDLNPYPIKGVANFSESLVTPIEGVANFSESLVIPIKSTVKGPGMGDAKSTIYRDAEMEKTTTEIPNENSNVWSYLMSYILTFTAFGVISGLIIIVMVKKLRDRKSDNNRSINEDDRKAASTLLHNENEINSDTDTSLFTVNTSTMTVNSKI